MTTFLDSAAVEREMGDGSRCLDPQLWHACAGGMVQMPPVGSRVYYFPQGHAEHAQGQAGTVDFPPGGRIPALVLCRVAAVRFMADPDIDEVFAKIRLVPARPQDPADTNDAIAAAQEDKPASFAKTLTQSDAHNGGDFSVPRYCAQTIFPPLDYSADPPVQTMLAKDVHGVVWKFRHVYRGTPRRHLLTTGWSSFVNQKKLVAGDSIVFMRTENGDLCLGIRRAKKGGIGGSELLPPPSPAAGGNYGGFSMFLRGEEDGNNKIMGARGEVRVRVRPEEVAEAANLAISGQQFDVLYYLRASTPEFCVKAATVRAAMRTQWCTGMRFKMAFETEDSSRISWFMGTVSAVQVADPIRWPNSPWRLLQVTWDQPDLLQNVKRVSPWLVELVSNNPSIHHAPFSPPLKKLFVPFYPDLPVDSQFPAHPSEFEALVQRLTGQDFGSLPSEAQIQDDQMDEVVQGQSLMPPELLPLPSAPMSWLSLEHGVTPPSLVDTTANDIFEDGLKKRRPEKFRSQGEQTRQIEKRLQKLHTEASVCAMADAMFSLPAKLDRLLAYHGHTLPRGAEDEIPLIQQDLEKMIAFIQEQDDSGAEDRSMTVKCLTKEVRELSYDMEDSVDQYVHAAATTTRRRMLSPRRKKYKITRRSSKGTTGLWEKLKWRLWMANKIREFSVRSQEALQRYSLFDHLAENGSNAAAISGTGCSTSPRSDALFSSWRPTPYEEPIGIDAPMEKLEAWLGKDREHKLKVVSLVGSGGIGKTTLANELYRRISGQFECRAFVRKSRKPDVRRLLISMLSQIRPHHPRHNWKMHSLIADIRTHLQDKRYLIIIDDVWTTQTWDIINRALPAGNHCSAILITTEVDDVALKCCGYNSKYVLMMEQLGHDDSSKLFFSTVFGPQYECPPELSEVGDSIIRKCAGLPLAMVTVASLLVDHLGKPERWHYVNKSLGYGLRTNPTSEGMKQVLNFSYNNLPQHLKPCVMYLSIYEEDYIIQKDDLVKQWIAESFIHATEEKDKEGISRSYFDQLISSRMILPVHINDNDDVLSCMVHHIVLDFLRQKSLEENFVTAIDHCQTTSRLADKVRRLSLHFGNAEATPPTNMRLSQVRTLAFFGVFKCLPSIVEFRLLQVLILHLWGNDESISVDLTGISELFRLRYLHFTCNATLEVPQNQMRGLQYLETLKIDARVSAVPSDIVHLPGLLHLSLPFESNLPSGIGSMTSLCTLGYFDLSVNSIDNVQSLGGLTNLWDLRLTCSTVPSSSLKSKMDKMGFILPKLSNLRSVTLEPSRILDRGPSSMSISCDGLSTVPSPPALLQRFEWLPCICTFSSIPRWIGHLNKLCILKIGVRELASNDVDVLRGFPRLTVLSLYVRAKPAERIVFTKTGFSVLKCFEFRCSVPWLEFEVDAMPSLLKLKLGFDAQVDQHSTIPVGILHLTVLKEICVKIGGAGASDPDKRAAESAWIDAIKMHPARPTFNMQCFDKMFNGKDDNNSGVRKEEVEHTTLEKQYDIMEENSIEKHGVLQMGTREDAHSRTKIDVQTPATMSVSAIGTMTAIDECVTYSQWAKSTISSPQSRWSGSQERSLRDGLLQLESGLQLLRDTLPAMYHIIDEAEWRSHEHHVAKLLPNLKDAVSEAEDFLDEFRWYKMKMQAEGNASHSTFIDFFHSVIQGSFINQLSNVQSRLNHLSGQLEIMRLHGVTKRFDKLVRPETTSFPNEAKLFGRDKELKQLFEFLNVPTSSKRRRATTSVNASTSESASDVGNESGILSLPVLPVVGIGGVGKTTLAQHFCNHQEVKSHFTLIVWICVSDDFDLLRLTKEVIQSCTGKEPISNNLDFLQHALYEHVSNKRLLIVLDDMWGDALKKNGECWKRFCAPFITVQEGSLVLVTTRCPMVAEVVRTMEPFILEGLKDDTLWDFFKLCMFRSESSNDPELESIGRRIIPKLKGSPLAAKTLGRMLSMDLQASHWKSILASELWELEQEKTDILPALQLSYMYLPFYLKKCFAFCAVYPKDYKFEKACLAEIWVAKGLVEPQGDVPIQDVGCQYFEDLVAQSFFQKFSGGYIIPHLLHDMAKKVSDHDCFILRNKSDFHKVPQNVRHLYVLPSGDFDESNLVRLCNYTKLRTLICKKNLKEKTSFVMDHWCTKLLRMRVVSCAFTNELPDSIGNWKHLRYLEISGACPMKRLPPTLCWLYNLQILYANKCKLESLPSDFGKLISLQKFESHGLQHYAGGSQDLIQPMGRDNKLV